MPASESTPHLSSRNRAQSIAHVLEVASSAERVSIACLSCVRMTSKSEILDRASMRSEDNVVNLSRSIVVTS